MDDGELRRREVAIDRSGENISSHIHVRSHINVTVRNANSKASSCTVLRSLSSSRWELTIEPKKYATSLSDTPNLSLLVHLQFYNRIFKQVSKIIITGPLFKISRKVSWCSLIQNFQVRDLVLHCIFMIASAEYYYIIVALLQWG